MSSSISASEGSLAGAPAASRAAGQPGTRALTVLAATGIGGAVLIMLAATLVRGGWMEPHVAMPSGGPPWQIPLRHVRIDVVTYGLWASALLAVGGVAAGLLAVRRGARYRPRILIIGGLLIAAVLTVLPPAGSTDPLDYAAYGRILAMGHSPYVLTPELPAPDT